MVYSIHIWNLNNISNVNYLNNIGKNTSGYYLLKEDIIIDNVNYTPLGTYKWKAKTSLANLFTGTSQ